MKPVVRIIVLVIYCCMDLIRGMTVPTLHYLTV
jgi:hypothetical protein